MDLSQVRVVLLDVEGTTTPIDFVYKTLFPYATSKIESFLREHTGEPEIAAAVRDLRAQHNADKGQGLEPPYWRDDSDEERIRPVVRYVRWLIARDSKATPLKSLQGRIWQQGFNDGELHGEVYEDVPRAFARWRKHGRSICIYSSGSVLAQQLLFRTVKSGDLTPQIAAYFDTQTGIKTASESYGKIAVALGCTPGEFLFLSDAPKEIEASRATGMHALLCQRDLAAHAALAAETISSFDQVLPD